ncbi:4Fe-4S binding protein [Pseudoflavonifractor phocaeensis]|uniref:4Fe-4S binding protein n=1 Tax=Pseudoflavonifractor phocaeensis TaxID=1870988 RepID=UPI00210EEB9D|nr:4Fe-4S binding protein [Pseudoflavonifractor phocaeensis]MCQ4863270.1 4Fe-4S binding protein [Pseudoflavonifractor phocaeensis]
MGVYTLCFSPTGGTKRVLDLLAAGLADVEEIDLSAPHGAWADRAFRAGDFCLIGVPSYGGRVPAAAVERLRTLRGNGAAAVLVTAYGNRDYDDTLLELRDEAQAAGFRAVAAVAAVAEHSIMRQFGAGRPDEADRAELADFAARIRTLAERGGGRLEQVPGNAPYRAYGGVPMKPKAGRDCTLCGVCAGLCPVEAIPRENPKETDAEKCITCMRCVTVCPSHARALNPVMLMGVTQKLKKACEGRKGNAFFS